MSSRPFVLTDTAESRGQKGDLCSLEARGEAALQKALCAPPPTTMCRETKSEASATDCCFVSTFFFQAWKQTQQSAFALVSAWYLYHPCMVTTPWAFPAFQGHTKAPLIGNHSSPANRQLHSTRPDNHSQLGAIHSPAIVRYQHISSANTHMKAHRSTLQYQQKLTGASMHALWILRREGGMLLQEDCNWGATSRAPRSFFGGAYSEFHFLFLLPVGQASVLSALL